ncbi:MAG: hypothetical protein HFJ27_00075 [Clostridia bacterium]|nr:hypothetical protein [Clostridia bacterium]
MKNLELVKSFNFNDVKCDIYSKDNEVFMTSTQLGEVLGYNNPRKSISNLVNRFEYLKERDFSGVIKLVTPSGSQETRVFTEDGIYEVQCCIKDINIDWINFQYIPIC